MPLDVRESKAVEEKGLLEEELRQCKQAVEAERAQVAKLKGIEAERKCVEEELRQSEDHYRRRR